MKRFRKHIIAAITILTASYVFASVLTVGATSNYRAVDVSGTWKLTLETQNGTSNPMVTFKQEGEELTGTYKGRFGESPLKGTVKL